MAVSKSSKRGGSGGGAVSQDSNLDKEVNGFYSCISKTHQDPIEKLDRRYYQALGGSGSCDSVGTSRNFVATRPGTNPASTPISTRQHRHKRSL